MGSLTRRFAPASPAGRGETKAPTLPVRIRGSKDRTRLAMAAETFMRNQTCWKMRSARPAGDQATPESRPATFGDSPGPGPEAVEGSTRAAEAQRD